MPVEPLSCQELVELITEYLEETLARDRRLAFEQHIAICPPCRGYLDEIRRTIEAAGALSEDTLPSGARDAMLAVFRDWRKEQA